ncbi:uncharacterized protein L969DRAFT_94913 [Mixia osmundae IAM 14324]|uniref:LDB19 N-terminal domain-containing protein n=1 Tax=Mixia osmundae (strain CBS 9802 / IAM 14324 / JCM 22182 / KY 12970) TaxID=764103 RepID=G7E1C5_MIXOS|nr:uncharacterized protein L969DRAFT_94913 [Mixia osmundae IAM 14324]KEI38727.1 hypothetical protein L969DRAFT_94913 [Mixia osmundae IAM 14324]GAA96635.1 hypothetical protein E5Q_03305 [Mixia osmundae IAM 14324]
MRSINLLAFYLFAGRYAASILPQEYQIDLWIHGFCDPTQESLQLSVFCPQCALRFTAVPPMSESATWTIQTQTGFRGSTEVRDITDEGLTLIARFTIDVLPNGPSQVNWAACCSGEVALTYRVDLTDQTATLVGDGQLFMYCASHTKSHAKPACDLDALGNAKQITLCSDNRSVKVIVPRRTYAFADRFDVKVSLVASCDLPIHQRWEIGPTVDLFAPLDAPLHFAIINIPSSASTSAHDEKLDWIPTLGRAPQRVEMKVLHSLDPDALRVEVMVEIPYRPDMDMLQMWQQCCVASLNMVLSMDVMTKLLIFEETDTYLRCLRPEEARLRGCSLAQIGYPPPMTTCRGTYRTDDAYRMVSIDV